MKVITMEQPVQFIVLGMVQNLGKIKRVNRSPGILTGQQQQQLSPSELLHFQLIEEKNKLRDDISNGSNLFLYGYNL